MTLEFRCKEGGRRPLWNSLEKGKPWFFFCWSHSGSVSDLPVSIAALPPGEERASSLASKGSCICHGNWASLTLWRCSHIYTSRHWRSVVYNKVPSSDTEKISLWLGGPEWWTKVQATVNRRIRISWPFADIIKILNDLKWCLVPFWMRSKMKRQEVLSERKSGAWISQVWWNAICVQVCVCLCKHVCRHEGEHVGKIHAIFLGPRTVWE